MLEPRAIPWTDILGRSDLLEAHYEELATNKALMELDPDTDAYQRLDDARALMCVGMYDGETLVGYSASFITNSMHYRQLAVCQNDVVFMDKAYRNFGDGKALIAATEAVARGRGARLMLWHAKPNTPLHALMVAIGNPVQDVIFSKEL